MKVWEASVLAAATGAFIWLCLYYFSTREYREPDVPRYLHEPLEGWRPSELGYLWKWGSLDGRDLIAMLMDLVERGALRLKAADALRHAAPDGEVSDEGRWIELATDFDGKMTRAEKYLVRGVLALGRAPSSRTSFQSLRQLVRPEVPLTASKYWRWKQLAEAESRRFAVADDSVSGVRITAALLGLFLLLPLPLVVIGLLNDLSGTVPALVGSAMLTFSWRMRRHTKQAAIALQRWRAFRRYLLDFSRLQDHPFPAVSVWGKYLVFAVALGIADRVIRQFRSHSMADTDEGEVALATLSCWLVNAGDWNDAVDALFRAWATPEADEDDRPSAPRRERPSDSGLAEW